MALADDRREGRLVDDSAPQHLQPLNDPGRQPGRLEAELLPLRRDALQAALSVRTALIHEPLLLHHRQFLR
jgi:hypothetical protein